MNENEFLAREFEAHRSHLRGVAYRMLGSLSEAEDAVQESWLRLSRADTTGVQNLGGWLTTVVARVSLDMLRSRKARREDATDAELPEPADTAVDPETELELASSVGLALLVVLETLAPAERLAFVLHDLFGVSFEEIADIVGRTPMATRQLASRARRRVQGAPAVRDVEVERQLQIVEAFLTASRGGSMEGLLAVLDPDVVSRVDAVIAPPGVARETRGAQNVSRNALAYSRRSRFAQAALLDGSPGIIVAPRGKLLLVMRFVFRGDRIAEIDLIGDPAELAAIEIAVLP
jgi:RNA polymerase sigma factor (sigma-70 family)